MADPSRQPVFAARFASIVPGPPSWTRVVLWALGVRIVAADLVQWWAQRKGVLCLFPDSGYYWLLAGKIRRGEPYELVDFGDLPRFSLRTPGYPLFLAGCQWLFGPRVLVVRLVQAALGAWCVWWVGRLTRRAVPADRPGVAWTVPLIAGLLAALEPYGVANAAFLLSEALFVPLLVLTQWGLAELWPAPGEAPSYTSSGSAWLALATGAGLGAAVLVRPSWGLYVPLALGVWVAAGGPEGGWRGRLPALRGAALVMLGLVVVMGPWWARNARIYGRFVPTALWAGASLYDGLNPGATGASDMNFLGDPEFWPLDEEAQDAVLGARALDFARQNPGRVARLAVVKAGRFWSPWPNAGALASTPAAVAGTAATLPVFALLALGLWDRRRDVRALALLALPLGYTFALHLVFVSSMRYRVPPMVPALGLAAVGARRAADWWQGRGRSGDEDGGGKT